MKQGNSRKGASGQKARGEKGGIFARKGGICRRICGETRQICAGKTEKWKKRANVFLETVDNSAVLNYNRHILKFNYWRAREAEKQGNMQNSSSERDEKRGSKPGGRAGKTACGDRAMGATRWLWKEEGREPRGGKAGKRVDPSRAIREHKSRSFFAASSYGAA